MESPLMQNLIQTFGISSLPADQQEETLLRIGNVIFQAVMIRVLDSLTDEEQAEFDALLTKNSDDQEAIYSYLKAKIPDFDMIVAEEVENFRAQATDLLPK